MAYAKATKITSWSISRFKDYDSCPLKAKLKHIDKMKEPSSPAMERGTEIHTLAEHYIKGIIRTVPAALVAFSDYFKDRRKQFAKDPDTIHVEQSWAYRNDWSITRFDDWTGCWLRVKVDIAWQPPGEPGVLIVDDVKTGRYKPEEHAEYLAQLDLYATGAMVKYPDIVEVRPRLLYVDHGVIHPTGTPIVYKRDQLDNLKKGWEKKVAPMFKDTKFPPKPSNGCRWCSFSSAKGGPCKF